MDNENNVTPGKLTGKYELIPQAHGGALVSPRAIGEIRPPHGYHGPLYRLAKKLRLATEDGDHIRDRLVEMLDDENPIVRLKACELMLRYGWGEPKKEIEETEGVDLRGLDAAARERVVALLREASKAVRDARSQNASKPPGP